MSDWTHARGMLRQPRFHYPGAVLHIVQRGNNRTPVVFRWLDREPTKSRKVVSEPTLEDERREQPVRAGERVSCR